jgi:hypothetical protein
VELAAASIREGRAPAELLAARGAAAAGSAGETDDRVETGGSGEPHASR